MGFDRGEGHTMRWTPLAYAIERRKVNWILDADIRAYFDTISRDWLIRFLEHRIGDRRVLRLIKKCCALGYWKKADRSTRGGVQRKGR